MKPKIRPHPRHSFCYSIDQGPGEAPSIQTVRVKVRKATTPVTLVLTADPVKRSIVMHGQGNTQRCSMALCVKAHAPSFPHPVVGPVDWTPSRVYICDRLNADNMPIRCVAYAHDDDIWRLNDSPGGQKRLLALIEEHGPITVRLKPLKIRTRQPLDRPRGAAKSKDPLSHLGTGAKRRFAFSKMGGFAG